jgi:hypothetical protein
MDARDNKNIVIKLVVRIYDLNWDLHLSCATQCIPRSCYVPMSHLLSYILAASMCPISLSGGLEGWGVIKGLSLRKRDTINISEVH